MPSIRLSKCKVLYLCSSHTHPSWGIQTRKPRLSEDLVCCPTSESDRAKPEFEPRHTGRSWDFFVKIAKMRNSQNIKILLMWCLFCFFQIWELTHNNSNITLRIPSFWVELWASASFPSGTVWIDHKLGPTPQCSYSLCALSTPFLQLRSAIFQPVCCKRHTGVQQEFLQHAIPNQWRALTSFPLDCQTKKNGKNQHNIVAVRCEWIKSIPIFCQIGKKYILLVCCRILVIGLYMKKVENTDLDHHSPKVVYM